MSQHILSIKFSSRFHLLTIPHFLIVNAIAFFHQLHSKQKCENDYIKYRQSLPSLFPYAHIAGNTPYIWASQLMSPCTVTCSSQHRLICRSSSCWCTVHVLTAISHPGSVNHRSPKAEGCMHMPISFVWLKDIPSARTWQESPYQQQQV